MSDSPEGPGWWMADDHKWYPPTDPTSPSAPPHLAPDDPEPSGDGFEHSGRRRTIALSVGLVALVVAAAAGMFFLGSSTKDSPAPTTAVEQQPGEPSVDPTTESSAPVDTTAPTTTVSPTAEADLRTAAAASGPVTAVAVIETPDGLVGVTLPSDANVIDQSPGAVQLWRVDAGSWVEDTLLDTPATVLSWSIDDATGDGTNDLVLEGGFGNDIVGMVLSVSPGAPRLIPFVDTDGTESDMTSALRFEAGGLTSSSNPCVPSCATGGVIDQVWTYDAATDRFTT